MFGTVPTHIMFSDQNNKAAIIRKLFTATSANTIFLLLQLKRNAYLRKLFLCMIPIMEMVRIKRHQQDI